MKKDIVLPGLAAAGGGLGFALRRWQLSSAFHGETGLFTHGAPATYALLGLTALLLLLLLALLWGKPEQPSDFLPAFGCPQAGQMTVLAAAGLLLLAAGLLWLKDGLGQLQLWQLTPDLERQPTQFTLAVTQLLTGLLCLPSGLAVLLLGRAAYRGGLPDLARRLSPLPTFTGLAWTFSVHMANGTQPILMRYGFTLAAAISFTLAHYYFAGFLFDRPAVRRALFFALAGVVLGLTSLADFPSLATAALTLSLALSALGFARALLGNAYGPGWPQPEPTAPNDENN